MVEPALTAALRIRIAHDGRVAVDRASRHDAIDKLFSKVSILRKGRGHIRPLTADDQLLLAELLFDVAKQVDTEGVVTWEIRINGASLVEDLVRLGALTKCLRNSPKNSRGANVMLLLLGVGYSRNWGERLQQLFNRARAFHPVAHCPITCLAPLHGTTRRSTHIAANI
jgi:hypothetical protein